jgi:hypothetical protein
MSYARIEQTEPTVLVGAIASVVGFLLLNATDFSTAHSAAVAVGGPATQALLTRPFVYSPDSIRQLESGKGLAMIPELSRLGTSLPFPGEPTATIGALTVLAGFLVQMFAGVDLTAALASSAGLAGVQTVATRSRVSSPATARHVAACQLCAEHPPAVQAGAAA